MIKVSVIIPVYNEEKYLQQCINSVINQSLNEIEIICVNNGSTDSSLEILSEFEKKDSRIKIINTTNEGGAGRARNIGLKHAVGEYLSFLDADDFFDHLMLETAYKKASEDKADIIIFCSDQYNVCTQEYVASDWSVRIDDFPPYTPFNHRQITCNIFKSTVGWAWDKLFKREFVKNNQLFFQELRTTNDLYFVFSALAFAKRITYISDVLAHHRIGIKESLSNTREKSWFCFYYALMALKQNLKKNNLYDELAKDFINYSLHFSLWNLNTLNGEAQHKLLKKLLDDWFYELEIYDKPKNFFYEQNEYKQYIYLIDCKKTN